jgi:hypothetical protein
MALFKDLFSNSSTKKDSRDPLEREAGRSHGPETAPVKMNLEERMAFRRELLYETLRRSLATRSIEPHTYRFKVMRTDKRGHCFVIMLDMSPAFLASPAGQHDHLEQLAALVTESAQTKYGLMIGGVYWRRDATLDAAVAGWAKPQARSSTDTHPDDANQSTEQGHHATAQDLVEFEAVWDKDTPVQIGNRTYATDLAPLAEDLPAR